MNDTTWHVSERLAQEYAAHDLTTSMAASVEAHLLRCAACRSVVGEQAPGSAVERVWQETLCELDAPRATWAERLATALGVRADLARLVGVTPALSVAWLGSLLVVSVLTAVLARAEAGPAAFVLIAPLLPVLGVGGAYALSGPGDPLEDATPFGRQRVLLLRTATVVATSVLIVGVGSFVVADLGLAAAAWLLPSLALTSATLAVGTTMTLQRAAGRVVAAWLVLAEVGLIVVPRTMYPTATTLGVLGAPLQLGSLLVLAVAGAVTVARRDLLDLPLS